MNAPANRPQLGDLPTMPIGEIAALPADLLALLQEEAEDAAKAARSLADWLNGAIALRYADRAAAARRAEGKDTGTVRLDDGEVTVIADLPKKVEWDQATLGHDGRRASAPPATIRPSTSRRPSASRSGSMPPGRRRSARASSAARTVKPGKPTFRLVLGEAR